MSSIRTCDANTTDRPEQYLSRTIAQPVSTRSPLIVSPLLLGILFGNRQISTVLVLTLRMSSALVIMFVFTQRLRVFTPAIVFTFLMLVRLFFLSKRTVPQVRKVRVRMRRFLVSRTLSLWLVPIRVGRTIMVIIRWRKILAQLRIRGRVSLRRIVLKNQTFRISLLWNGVLFRMPRRGLFLVLTFIFTRWRLLVRRILSPALLLKLGMLFTLCITLQKRDTRARRVLIATRGLRRPIWRHIPFWWILRRVLQLLRSKR